MTAFFIMQRAPGYRFDSGQIGGAAAILGDFDLDQIGFSGKTVY
jgi:hypothetical protein